MGCMLGCSQWAPNVLCHFTSAGGQQYYCMMVLMVSNCTYTGTSYILMTKWSVFLTLFLYSELPMQGTELHWICTEWTVTIVSACALLATVPWPSLLSLKITWQHRWAPVGSHQDVIKVTHKTDVSLEEMYCNQSVNSEQLKWRLETTTKKCWIHLILPFGLLFPIAFFLPQPTHPAASQSEWLNWQVIFCDFLHTFVYFSTQINGLWLFMHLYLKENRLHFNCIWTGW